MPRPSRAEEQRREFLPILVQAFGELGFRRSTTAELARRCGVRENILYRLWADKKAMFIAALDHVFDVSERAWQGLQDRKGEGSAAARILEYEAHHHGEFGNFKIVFAGLSESDDPEIRAALRKMYRRFQARIQSEIESHRGVEPGSDDAGLAAWALIGLATTANIGRQLRCLDRDARSALFGEIGQRLLDGE